MKALFFVLFFAGVAFFAFYKLAPREEAPEVPPPLPPPPPAAPAVRKDPLAGLRTVAVHGAQLEETGAGAWHLKMPSAEWSCGMRFEPAEGESFIDLKSGKYLALDVENLSPDRQMRLTMHISSGGADGAASDHAAANFTKNLTINTGIGLNPGEKGTMRMLLPHPEVYSTPEGAPGPRLVDTAHVRKIELMCQWPFEDEFRWVADCRISNLRLEGEPDAPYPRGASFFPFIDRYGQFKHAEWAEKVHSGSELREDLKREEAAIAASPQPAAWDRYGGWAAGPRLAATGRFRTEKVDGKWWLVTPAGTLFFSTGVDVLRNNTDSSDGSKHPDWHETPVPPNRMMAYPDWNLRLKFGKDDYLKDYYVFCQKRLRSWGLNTIGNWAADELLAEAKVPYVACVLEFARTVPRHPKFHIYDLAAPDFETKFREAIRAGFAENSRHGAMLRHAARDPLCIGFFIDNELQFQKWLPEMGAEKAAPLLDLYFRICKEELARVAPGKLYLGCRFVGFRQSGALWNAAARYCDVVSVNAYANSIANISSKIMDGSVNKPILVGEFHFGCMDRGMFKASLCPVGDQTERGRSYARFVEGALAHPLVVGCHWFQWRDQPLIGRGDGEAYQCGFVDGTDRPYVELCAAARSIGDTMYAKRKSR